LESATVTRTKSLTLRLTLIAALGALPILFIVGGLLLWLFADRIERRFDSFLGAFQQQLIAAAEIGPDGKLRLTAPPADPRFNLPFSGWYWQIRSEGRVLAQSPSAGPMEGGGLGGIDSAADATAYDAVGPGGTKLRAVSRNVRLPGAGTAVEVLIAGPHAEIDEETRSFGLQLALTLGALELAFLVATVLQVRFGLAPLRDLRGALQRIREGTARRLIGDYPAEVTPMVDELNEVLTRNAGLIERARTQAGNLAHAVKNPLTVLRQELSAIEGERGTILRDQLAVIGSQVDRTLARIRTAGPSSATTTRSPLARAIADLDFSLQTLYRERHLKIETAVPADLNFRGDSEDLTEMLGNLMDNASKWATSRLLVSAGRRADGLRISIEDDGPGIPPAQREAALKRGRRLDESVPGSGLGLDIVREIAELYGGQLSLGDSSLGGLAAHLDLPGD
jgi:signal transduction histidine kinase